MSTQPTPAPAQSTHPNPVVARCLHAFTSAYKATFAINQNRFDARGCAATAYREAMPSLDGPANIRDFIACVAQGILVGAIEDAHSSKLLYAAQVALAANRAQPAEQKSEATPAPSPPQSS